MIYRAVPPILIEFLRREEGVRYSAYRDLGGVWTCGVGSTNGVNSTTVWNDGQVNSHLIDDLRIAQARLYNVIGQAAVDRLNDWQYGALLSFVFNVGAKPGWSIWPDVRHGRFGSVPVHLERFDNVNGAVVPGLQARRKAECALWGGTDPLCKTYPLTH